MDSKEKSSRQSTGCRTTSPLELFPTIPSSSMRREHGELQWKSGKITLGFSPGKQLSYWVRLLAWKVLGNSITGTTYAGATGIVGDCPIDSASAQSTSHSMCIYLDLTDTSIPPSIHPSYISIYLPYPTLPYPTLPYPTLPYPTLPYPTYLHTYTHVVYRIHTYTHVYTYTHIIYTNTHKYTHTCIACVCASYSHIIIYIYTHTN